MMAASVIASRSGLADARGLVVEPLLLAPVPGREVADAVHAYPGAELVWVQDEPENQGAWPFMALNLPRAMAARDELRPLSIVAREASASPATGSGKRHAAEQADLMARAFDR